jgi:DivIVA domain-containing protein
VDAQITPEALREEVRFQVKLRGYDQVEVDDLLDRVADAIEGLQRQVQLAVERAERAEQALADGAATDEALRRTLVLAQRVADEAVQQANAEAERIRDAAESAADQAVREAERRAAMEVEEVQRRLRSDVHGLEQARSELRADVEALEEYLLSERDRLRELLHQQLERLDQLGEVALAPAPALRQVDVPPEEPPPPAAPMPSDGGADDDLELEGDGAADGDRDDPEPVADRPVRAPSPAAEDDDPYFRELRRALSDDEELGPREHVPGESEDPDLALPDRFRWGLRRRR